MAPWKTTHQTEQHDSCVGVLGQVLGGADLFLQGFIPPEGGLPHFAAGDLMAITVRGNPLPIAVGTMESSIETVQRSGKGTFHAPGNAKSAVQDGMRSLEVVAVCCSICLISFYIML